MQRFQGGLVFKAHRLVYHSTLGLRVIKKKKTCRACLDPRGPIRPKAGLSLPLRHAPMPRGGPIHPEAGLSIPRRAYPSRGGPIYPEAGLSIPRRAYLSRGGPIHPEAGRPPEGEFFIDNLLVRVHFIIVMIRWTGLAPWEFESPFPGSLTSTFLEEVSEQLFNLKMPFPPGLGAG